MKPIPRHIGLAMAAALVAACASGGISRDRAMELAIRDGGDSPIRPTVVWAEAGPLGRFVDPGTAIDERRDRQVWAVLLAGSFGGECVAGAMCPPGATRKLVVFDFATGEYMFAEAR